MTSLSSGGENEIRSFIYLDAQKMRSYSSQVFEGVAERIIATSSTKSEEVETQKGSLTSGKVLADLFAKESSSSQLKFLDDYAYTLFENALIDTGKICIADSNVSPADLRGKFVKVSGRLQLSDIASMRHMLENFNDIGLAIWRTQNVKHDAPEQNGITEKEAKKAAAAEGLQLNSKFSDAMTKLLDFGYTDLIEASIEQNDSLYTAPLKREFMRDDARMIMYKYSKSTQISFTVSGIITQVGSLSSESNDSPDVKDADGLKEAIRTLAIYLREVESTFSGPSKHEAIIDPVAIYCSIEA